MKKMLCIIGTLNAGGAETFMMKLYREMDLSQFQLDFVVTGDGSEKGFYYDEVTEKGARVYYVPSRAKKPYKSFKELKRIVKSGEYSSVLKLCSTPAAIFDLIAVKAGGAKKIIVRACNAPCGEGAHKIKNGIPHFFMSALSDVKIAPSDLAAEYVFGHKAVEKGEIIYLHNALDLDVYRYDEGARERIRKELGIENASVYGHIGRFNSQKNHEFLIDIFGCIKEKEKDSVLLLLGEGELMESIEKKALDMGLKDSIFFLGIKRNVPDYLSAMDIFILPSFYEGMPNVIIEAQGTGLPCLVSDTVTREAAVTDSVKYMPLNASPYEWADAALNLKNYARKSNDEELRENGYDIADTVKQFQELAF